MGRMRKIYERYERAILIGLVIFVLIIFTVTSNITNWMRSLFVEQGVKPTAVAGTFSLLPGEKTEITYQEYERAKATYARSSALFARGGSSRVQPSQVWTHMLLLAAARKEGITVSVQDVTDFLRRSIPPSIFNDRPGYKQWIRNQWGVSPRGFEEGVRELLLAARMRDLYRQSYTVAPPETREVMVKQFTGRNLEFARVSWMRLPVGKFLKAAEGDLRSSSDPDKALRAFFEKDPGVKANQIKFRHPKRYNVEILYTIHKKIDDAAIQRVQDLFSKTWPELDMSKLEPKVRDMREFFGIYQKRLLDQLGKTISDVPFQDPEKPEDSGEGEQKPDPEKPEDSGEGEQKPDPEMPATLTPDQRKTRFNRAFDLCHLQVERELRIRGMFQYMRDEAAKDPKKSLKDLFEKLQKNGDPKHPICATEPGKGLIQLLIPEQPLSGAQIEELEDSGVAFTHNVRIRISSPSDRDLPVVSKAEVLGMAGHGRMIFRLISVVPASRKTYDDLSDDEKAELRAKFYVPDNARSRARERLEELKKKCDTGEISPAEFRSAGEAIGCGVIENEWILATSKFMAEPARRLYWRDEFLHMRDRHFLRRRLASILSLDRVKTRYKAGSYLPVQVDSREDAEDPGAAYLILLLERKQPDADSVPLDEFESFVNVARKQLSAREQDRWGRSFPQLKNQFEMEFFGNMQDRIEDEMEQLRKAERKRAGR